MMQRKGDKLTTHMPFLERVRLLHSSYCASVDNEDFTELVALFAPDAEIDYGPTLKAQGTKSIDRLFRALRSSCEATSHHTTNTTADPLSLSGMTYVMAWHKFADAPDLKVWGRYLDEFVTKDDELRVSKRTLLVHGSTRPMHFNTLPRIMLM